MQSNFEILCKQTRNAIAVPAMNLAAIRARQTRERAPYSKKRRGVLLGTVATLAMAAAAAAGVVGNSHFFFTPRGGVILQAKHIRVVDNVTPADLEAAAQQADFHVTLPQGLPSGTHLKKMTIGDRSVIALQYDLPGAYRRDNHLLAIFLMNPSAVTGRAPNGGNPYIVRYAASTVQIWTVAGEAVVLVAEKHSMQQREIDTIKNAMLKTTSQP